jgi:predicted anti-sigma-YlaC factor YlaD
MKHMEEMISAYIDNELTNEERMIVEQHIEACEQCRSLVDELSFIKYETFVTYQSIDTPEWLTDKIIKSIKENGSLTTVKNNRIPMVIAGLLLCLFFAGFLLSVGIIGIGFLSPFTAVLVAVWKVITLLISEIPYLLSGIIGVAVFLLLISIWFLRHLLPVKTVE